MTDLLFWPGLPYVAAAVVVWPARWVVLLVLDGYRSRQAERNNELRAWRRVVEASQPRSTQ